MTPVILAGKNLGERHHNLNKIVQETYERKDDFVIIQDLPEASPIDRLFKIDLASKLRNTEYIIKNLKDYDMLYVSKALKCKWLVEVEEIVNPEYLEEQLYPDMITTGVTKMKQWVFINLKNEDRCQAFYQYYRDKMFDYAIKFLRNCACSFLMEQFPLVISKICPHYLKIFCEKDPQITKMYFDSLSNNDELKSKYLTNEKGYFNVLINYLKSDIEFVLDTAEKIFNTKDKNPFGPKATRFIMRHYKERFWKKPELYTVHLLDFKTLRNCLNAEEIKNLIVILARAKFLSKIEWFSYKKVENLINKLEPEEKRAFKRKIFVNKHIEEGINEWPYDLPSPPAINESAPNMFDDKEHSPSDYEFHTDFRSMLKKRKYCKWGRDCASTKTLLDELFNEFRFASFNKTLFELRKRIRAESIPKNRQYMLLVLVSKSGGHEENICKLIELLNKHRNEPCQIRSVIVRSLVKRAKVWRLSEDTWNMLIEFAHGLGLDGKHTEANCLEGIHAIFIRQLFVNGQCQPVIRDAFLKFFSTLKEYPFNTEEKEVISRLLPSLIFSKACEEEDVERAAYWINILLDTLTVYKIPIATYTNLISQIELLANKDVRAMSKVLKRLFEGKIERRALFKVNFEMIQSEDSYLNALRHNICVISPENLVNTIKDSRVQYQKFFNKISIYFKESSGLVDQFLNKLKAEGGNVILAKTLTILLGSYLEDYLKSIDSSNKKDKAYEAAVKANIHLARPMLNINSHWETLGAKAIANRLFICKDIEVNDYVQKLLEDKRTMKLTLVVGKRNNRYADCLAVVGKIKPTKAIKSGLKYLKLQPDFNVWNVMKPLIESLGGINSTANTYEYLLRQLSHVKSIPLQIRPEYSVAVFKLTKNILSHSAAVPLLCHITNLLPKINEEFVETLMLEFLEHIISDDQLKEYEFIHNSCLYINVLVKFLLLCKTKENQSRRLNLIGKVFLDKMEDIWCNVELRCTFFKFLNEVFLALKYHKVFLSSEYVSCLPVMELISNRLEKILPLEKHFKIFVRINVIIFYYKSIRSNLDIVNLEDFYHDKNQLNCFTEKVANVFSKYIIEEIDILKKKHFISIEYLYKDCVLKIIKKKFENSSNKFIEYIIKRTLVISQNKCVTGLYLFKEKYNCLDNDTRKLILNKITDIDDINTKMIIFGDIL